MGCIGLIRILAHIALKPNEPTSFLTRAKLAIKIGTKTNRPPLRNQLISIGNK
jgi:hypothetical protein